MKNASFQAARPVWACGLCREMNITLRFEADLPDTAGAVLRIAGSSAWQIFLGEAFLAAGPARAGHGYRRVDEIPLPAGGGKPGGLTGIGG